MCDISKNKDQTFLKGADAEKLNRVGVLLNVMNMKQLFISLILIVCFVACTNEEEGFSQVSSSKMSALESDECVQENANQLNSSLLERFKVLTRGENNCNEEYPEFFGGSIINEDGTLTIFFTGDSLTSVNAIRKISNSPLLRFKKCQFSYQKLTHIMHFLNDNIHRIPTLLKGEIAGFGINEQENKIDICLVHKNNFVVSLFSTFFKHPAIKFIETGKIVEAASSKVYVCPGYKLGLDITNPGIYGSFGFSARELDGERRVGMVTAGHVVNVTNRIAYYNDDIFGYSDKVIQKGTVDAAFIPRLETDLIPSNAINGDYNAVLSKLVSSPGVGTFVNKWGAYTGHSGGKILSTNFTKVDDNGNAVLTDLTSASLTCDHGDSGGIVYTYISSKKTRLTVGIIHGFTATDKSIAVFSKAGNILKELNIERY